MNHQKQESEHTPQEAVDYSKAENREISQDYRIVTKQGAGGCSVVYDAWHIADGHHVAIKVLALPEDLEESEAELTKARFYREARILSTLKNEHCIHCLEYGVFSGAPCVVLEFVEGQQLNKYLKEFGAVPFEYGVDIVCQVLEALEEAHSLGIIHRDIKPANIMIIQDSDPPVVRLIDFGIASLLEGALGDLMKTKLGVIRGTPSYMAPELFSGTVGASPESDIYAIGLVLYEILTGSVAVTGSNVVQIGFKQAHEPLVVPKNIPECLARIIRKCCEKSSANRYHNARDIINDLREALPEAVKQRAKCEADYLESIRESGGSLPSFSATTGLGMTPLNGLGNSGVGMQPVIVQTSNTNKTVIGIVIAALVIIAGVVVFLVISRTSGEDSAEIYKAKAEAEAAKAEAEAAKAKMLEAEVERANEAAKAAEAAKVAEAARAAEAERAAEAARAAEAEAAAKAAEAAQQEAAAMAGDTAGTAPAVAAETEAAKPAKPTKSAKPAKRPSNNDKRVNPTDTESPPAVAAPPAPKKKGRSDPTSIPLDML